MVTDVLKINSKIHFNSLPSDSKESPSFQLAGVSDFGNLTLWIGISRKRVRPMLWKVASVYVTAPYIVHITRVTFFWNEVEHRHNLIKCLGVIEQRLVSNIGLQKILLSDNISRFLLIYKLCLLVSCFFFLASFPILAELKTTLLLWEMQYAPLSPCRNTENVLNRGAERCVSWGFGYSCF